MNEISISIILTQFLNGLVIGMTLVLLALGLSIIFGMLKVINFAHGALYTVGAYFAVFMVSFSSNFWVALTFAALATGALGITIERVCVRPLYGKGEILPLLLTFALSMIISELVIMVWGTMGYDFHTPKLLEGFVNLGFVHFPTYRLFLIGFTAVLCLCLWLFLERSRLGLLIRAGTEDIDMARALGIKVKNLFTMVFFIGAGLAGVAGVIAAPLKNVNPHMGVEILVQSFVVVTVGGMGSFRGSIWAGIIIGELMVLTVQFWPSISHVSIFAFMALVLLLKPEGLFGKK